MSHDDDNGASDPHLNTRLRVDSRPEIPTIITSDLSSNVSLSHPHYLEDHAASSPEATGQLSSPPYNATSDRGLLSPTSILRPGRTSIDAPSSPTGSAWGSDATHVPASPTSSIHSVPSVSFAQPSTLALRDNNPNANSGFSSLGLLHPSSHGGGHRRKGSNASSVGSETDPDSHSISMNTLAPSVSPTHSHFDGASDAGTTIRERSPSRSKSHKGKDSISDDANPDDDKEPERPAAPDVTLDADIDAAPFKFKPYQLASLVDPKNMPALTEMGGVTGLLKGLGTHAKHGISDHATATSAGSRTHGPGDGSRTGAGDGASHRHEPPGGGGAAGDAVPDIKVIGDDGEEGEAEMVDDSHLDENLTGDADYQAVYAATMEDRHRVFGENVLPIRKTKSLLQLMWMALKDKVLVSLRCDYRHICAVSYFRNTGASFYRSRCLVGPWILPRFRNPEARRRTPGRLGRRRGYHCGYYHRGKFPTFVLLAICADISAD